MAVATKKDDSLKLVSYLNKIDARPAKGASVRAGVGGSVVDVDRSFVIGNYRFTYTAATGRWTRTRVS